MSVTLTLTLTLTLTQTQTQISQLLGEALAWGAAELRHLTGSIGELSPS